MQTGYKLKLLSKRLKSGKCQIKFYVTSSTKQIMYGYLLTEAGSTLKEVVGRIEDKVRSVEEGNERLQPHLFNLGSRVKSIDNILLFSN